MWQRAKEAGGESHRTKQDKPTRFTNGLSSQPSFETGSPTVVMHLERVATEAGKITAQQRFLWRSDANWAMH